MMNDPACFETFTGNAFDSFFKAGHIVILKKHPTVKMCRHVAQQVVAVK
jgi:hypothetical protein